MKKYILGIMAVLLAVVSVAFTKPKDNLEAEYWVYTSDDNSNFREADKYTKELLTDPEALNCPDAEERPCVFQEATGSISDAAGLDTYLQGLSGDPAVIDNSLHTKENQ